MMNEQKNVGQTLRKHSDGKKQPMPGKSTKADNASARAHKSSTAKIITPTVTTKASAGADTISVKGIELDAQTARNAIIMSEIIGPPKAKRRRGRCY